MNSEQRALATLDLSLKNAFETLNKYSIWATTPESEVTFNLVDAVPTLESAGSGIFLKPITVPSFASVRSSIFGTVGTPSSRALYWNLDFIASKGWKFTSYDPNEPAILDILVDTNFGSEDVAISITDTNVTEQLINSALNLDANSRITLTGPTGSQLFNLTAAQLRAKLESINLGTVSASTALYGKSILLSNGSVARDVFRYTNTAKGATSPEVNKIVIGPGNSLLQSTFATILRSGSLEMDLIAGKDFTLKFLNQGAVHGGDLLRATYNTPNYDIYLAYNFGNVNSLNIGDVSNLDVKSSDSFKLYGDYGSIFGDEDGISVDSNLKLTLTSETLTRVGSKTEVDIGIEDDNGNISREIQVTKGSVVIPNLYVQKKANYILSGIKHVSPEIIDPSVVYYPDSVAKTLSDGSFAFEYSKNITTQTIEETSANDFASTINDLSGSVKSYLVRLVDDGIEFMKADATYVDPVSVVTSKYEVVTSVVGLSNVSPYKSNAQLQMISTPNGMYIFVHELEGTNHVYNVYYSVDALNFSKLHSYTISGRYIYEVSIDYTTTDTVDYIWFTHTTGMYNSTTNYCEYDFGTTYILFHLENNCSVVKSNIFNGSMNQIVAGSNPAVSGQYGRYGSKAKVVVVPDAILGSYAMILGAYGCSWVNVTTKKTVGDYIGGAFGGVGHTVTGRTPMYSHALFLMKYSNKYNFIEESVMASFVTDNGNGSDFVLESDIVDFSWNGSAGTAIVASASSSKTVVFNSTKEQSSSVLTNANVKYSQALHSVGTEKIVLKMLVNKSTPAQAFLCEADNNTSYVLNATLTDSLYGNIISSLGVMYYDWTTSSIVYYDNGVNGVSRDLIEVIVNKSVANGAYDLTGAIVDYIGLNYLEYGSFFTNFVLSSVAGGDFLLTNSEDTTDRRVYVEKNIGDITSIIESSNTTFNPSKLSKVISTKYDKTKSIVVSLSNMYNSNGKISEVAPVVRASSIETMRGAMNFHIEPISYLVKNRNMGISTLELGNYTISSTGIAGLYILQSSDNMFSGYRVPYATDRSGNYAIVSTLQAELSNQSTSAPESPDMNSSLESFCVTIDSEYCHIHDNISIGNSTMIVSIPFGLIDPTDATFDPSCAIVNEFSNVVSIKLPYMFGVRSQNCGRIFAKGKSNLILGLTEVAEIGGGC